MNRWRGGSLALAVLFGLGGLTGVAHADTVSCGQVIRQDTVLDADVGPCTGTGIIIGAAHITLDLGGHKVFGTASNTDTGILIARGVLENHTNGTTITNGTVTGFGRGVHIDSSYDNVLHRLLIADNCSGISLTGASMGQREAKGNVIRGNKISDNRCAGIQLLAESSRNEVSSNLITGNSGSGVSLQGAFINTPRFNTVRGNAITRNGADGIDSVIGGYSNVFSANVVSLNGRDGIRVGGLPIGVSTVEQNRVFDNGRNGISLTRGGYVTARGNTALGNAAFDLADDDPQCAGHSWQNNTFGTRNQLCIA